MKILLVEDDARTADFIVTGLAAEGFTVRHAADGSTGMDLGREEQFDAAVIDIMLPGLDGLSVVERLRASGSTMPVLFLSARKTVEDRLKGFKAGGDDYLVKPFSFAELVARLRALLRRSRPAQETNLLAVADLEVDLLAHKVRRAGQEINLQQREFALLAYLLHNRGRVVSKMMILEHVWGYDFDPQTNVVEACVCRLRDKIDQDAAHRLIRTVRGVGYVLDETRP
ncbi:response regulator transcription factor [Desulfolithobacter dissulfuricans]|nr:response regulator transcription factor [Desulfolithobacter dissulfuricans]